MTHTVPFLTLLILLPATGALGARRCSGSTAAQPELAYAIGLIVSLVTLGFAIATLVAMKVHDGGFQLVSDHDYTGSASGCTGTSASTASPSSWSC